jgi:hypothetical protein
MRVMIKDYQVSSSRIHLALAMAGVALVLAAGAAYGHYARRWGAPPDLDAAAQRVVSMPKQIGNWHLDQEEEMSAGTIQMLECAGYVNRRYVDTTTGESVSIAVIVGPPGPIAVHTPEICYSSRNYKLARERETTRLVAPDGKAHQFWNTGFSSRGARAEGLNVLYAWSAGDEWIAAKSPRFEFATSPALYKLQIACLQNESEDSGKSANIRFLKELLKSGWRLNGSTG